MELTLTTTVLLPAGLGLLGFVEPCTVGAHLIFLSEQTGKERSARAAALASFVGARTLVMGLFGALIGFAGQWFVSVQTGFWLFFGLVYLGIGAAYAFGHARLIKGPAAFAPEVWRQTRNPAVLGLAFGLNIPACAAPILFGLLGLTVSGGSALAGFAMMALFGFALSAPLIPMALEPRLAASMVRIAHFLRPRQWVLGAVFIILGVWSIYFGLFVDPVHWSGR